MGVKAGIPIFQLLRGPDRHYTVANLLHAFAHGETVTLWSYDEASETLVPNKVLYVAKVGMEYPVEITDENGDFFCATSSQNVLTNEGMVPITDLNSKHKLVRPTKSGVQEVGLKARRTRTQKSAGFDKLADEREFIYSVCLEGEPNNVIAGSAVIETVTEEED